MKTGIGLALLILFSSAYPIDLSVNQLLSARVNQAGGGRLSCAPKLRCSLGLTTKIYQSESNLLFWSKDGKVTPLAYALQKVLKLASNQGLDPNDYHVQEIAAILEQENKQSLDNLTLLNLDLTLTDAFLLYAKHMVYGRLDNHSAYPDWIVSKRNINLTELFKQAIASQDLQGMLQAIMPHYAEYYQLQEKLQAYRALLALGGWESIPLGPTLGKDTRGKRIYLLYQRLLATGELQQVKPDYRYTNILKSAIIKYQNNNGLKASGVVDKDTLSELNRPLSERIKIIELNMDRLRWLPLDMGGEYILVNIPDYSLQVIKETHEVMGMPVIVGKAGNRSCVLSSQISYLELNPYWNIPDSVVHKELLPKLRHNANYLNLQAIKVYTSFASPALDPLKVNWNSLNNPDLNHYKFRQLPGEKNALGHVKFIFPNACGIYLHDTPNRNLFSRRQRALSHGCIRIAQPLQLAGYLLASNSGWDVQKIESQVATGKRQVVILTKPMQIHILYATAWVDQNNDLQFRRDLYKIDKVNYPPSESSGSYAPNKGDYKLSHL